MPSNTRFGARRSPLAKRTWRGLRFDLLRLRARLRNRRTDIVPPSVKLHQGCGNRRIPGWLNVDVAGSDYDIDLGAGRLPWAAASFETIASQHVIEHLDVDTQLLPLMSELRRGSKDGAEIWLSCPDMEKVCRAYLEDRGQSLLEGRMRRWPSFSLHGKPVQHITNDLFHQDGEHVNLFDFEYLEWLLTTTGFRDVERVPEAASGPGFRNSAYEQTMTHRSTSGPQPDSDQRRSGSATAGA